MATVLLALDDIGLAVSLQESLEATGHRVRWEGGRDREGAGQEAAEPEPDVVLVTPDPSRGLEAQVEAWRAGWRPPAVLVVAADDRTRREASAARAPSVAAAASRADLGRAVEEAARLRFAARLSPAFAMGALGLHPEDRGTGDAIRIVRAARGAELDVVREALRWHAGDYAAATHLVGTLREHRALEIPEVELCLKLDGARTVRTVVAEGGLDAAAAARLLWALASIGAVTLSPEPPTSTLKGRAVAEARGHLRARRARLASATAYDVLEVRPDASGEEVERAVRMLAIRYDPDRLAGIDLGDVGPLVQPNWREVQEAYRAIASSIARKQYDASIAARVRSTESTWAHPVDRQTAEEAFVRGQRALLDGDVFRAVSEMARAARTQPDHPDYEATLAWARYRAELARGKDKGEAAARERASAEEALAGRRPWPRALVALGLLSAAAGDPDAARWHLREALTCDPTLPMARQALSRLAR